MIWVAYITLGALFLYLAKRFVERHLPDDDPGGCDCPACRCEDRR